MTKRRDFADFAQGEIIDLFEAFAARHGLERADGRDGEWKDDPRGGIYCRMKEPEAKRGTSSATAHLYLDVPQNGFIEDYKRGRLRWKISEDDAAKSQTGGSEYHAQALTADERAALEAARKRERAERQRQADEITAAARARMLQEFREARPVTDDAPAAAPGLEYLRLKGVFAARGTRLDVHGNLLVPFFSMRGEFVLFQRISPAGKFFPAGARFPETGAAFWVGAQHGAIRPPKADERAAVLLALCEGYATAASFYRAAGILTGATGNAHNLEKTARAILAAPEWERAFLILAADDDFLTEREGKGNAGINAALAARSVNSARVFIAPPPWNQKEITESYKAAEVGKVSDWNDFATMYGKDTAQAAARDALKAARAYFARMRG